MEINLNLTRRLVTGPSFLRGRWLKKKGIPKASKKMFGLENSFARKNIYKYSSIKLTFSTLGKESVF